MTDQERKLFLTKLNSLHGAELLQTLENFGTNGDAQLLPDVLNILINTKESEVYNAIIDIVSTLKDDNASQILFNYVYDLQHGKIKQNLLTALWQTGCDFSHEANRIVEMLFAAEDFETAFEVLTLLENSVVNLESDVAFDYFNRIKNLELMGNPDFSGIYSAAKEHFLVVSRGEEF